MPANAAPTDLLFETRLAWERWLDEHHASSPEVWMRLAKAGAKTRSITYAEALDVALCHGWIDGQKRPVDEQFWLQRFTPRAARSKWSKVNCGKALSLIESGLMRPWGLAEVERARSDGRWERAYDPPSKAVVPPDLERALALHPAARAFFATLDSQNRYAILYRIQEPRKPETRARRVAAFVAMLAEGRKVHE